jgi:PQQ-dependent catabolism-associated CXXCW motif protein
MASKGMPRHICKQALLTLLLAFSGHATAGEVAEPQSYWMGTLQGDVPATIAHGHVIHVDALADLIAKSSPVLIDAAEQPRRPSSLAPDAVWKPVVHRNIAGSIWLPGIGQGGLDADRAHVFETRLAKLTHGDLDKPVVVYCHQHCWGSWNGAKRAISFGYRNVYWYPEGVEGWQDAGRDLVAAEAQSQLEKGQAQESQVQKGQVQEGKVQEEKVQNAQ